jgi:hypothetical protein
MEQKCSEKPDFDRVSSIAKRFGASEVQVWLWMTDAKDEELQEKVA